MHTTSTAYRQAEHSESGGFRAPRLLLLLLLLTASPISAEEAKPGPWAVTADRITSRQTPQEVIAEGQVVVDAPAGDGHGPLTITADTLSYQGDVNLLTAHGQVYLKEEGSGLVRADGMSLNLADRTGRLDATTISLADQELNLTGRLAEKTGPSSYRLEDGIITSCPIKDDRAPIWSIHSRETRVTIDGMAFLKHASLWIGPMPVLYTPFLIVPAKTTRQSGFLFPELYHSRRDGTGFIAPLFVNLSPSSDLTLYPGYYSLRGPFFGLQFRHLNSADSLFAMQFNYLRDKTMDTGPAGSDEDYRKDGYLRDTHDRYWLHSKGDHYFSPQLALRLDLDAVSDQDFIHEYRSSLAGLDRNNRDFLKSFNRGLTEASLEYRESTLQLAGRGELTTFGAELSYGDDSRRRQSDIEPIQTLPRLTVHSRLPLYNLPISLAWDSEYLNYYLTEGVGYQRLDLASRLLAPLPQNLALEGSVTGGVRETAYQVNTYGNPANGGWRGRDNPTRTAWNFDANVATLLNRDYHPDGQHLKSFSHLVRPNIGYRYQGSTDQHRLPEIDGTDRLPTYSQLYWQLNNYFQAQGRWWSSQPYTGQTGNFRINQSYDVLKARQDPADPTAQRRPFSDLGLDLELAPLPAAYLRYQTNLSMYGEGFTSYLLQGSYSNNNRDALQFYYNYVRNSTSDLSLSLQLGLTRKLTASYITTLSLSSKHKTGESLILTYTPQCWSMAMTISQDSTDRRLMLVFSLTGIGKALEFERFGL